VRHHHANADAVPDRRPDTDPDPGCNDLTWKDDEPGPITPGDDPATLGHELGAIPHRDRWTNRNGWTVGRFAIV
jgi:hypothetical protein